MNISLKDLPKPNSRVEKYLAYLTGKEKDLNILPKPISRLDLYLYHLCYNGIEGNTPPSGGENLPVDEIMDRIEKLSLQVEDISPIVVYTKNLFDKESAENELGYIKNTGVVYNDSNTHKTTYMITELIAGNKYIITPKIRKFLAYDKNKNPIKSSYINDITENYVFTMPEEWSGIRFTYYIEDENKVILAEGEEEKAIYEFGKDISFNTFQVEEIKSIISSNLKRKVLFNFGDSIAAGDGNNGKGYAELLAEKYVMTCHNFAQGGSTITTKNASKNIIKQVEKAIASGITPDYILINGGDNDISTSYVPSNEEMNWGIVESDFSYQVENLDKTTIAGAMQWILHTLKINFPDTKIVFVSVHKMASRKYDRQVQCQGLCSEICKKYSVPVADIFNRGNLNTCIDSYSKYTNPTDSIPNGDKTHPNEEGYIKFYLPLIYEVLINI